VIQSLWSGYGSIKKYELLGCDYPTVIVKHVKPDQGAHPRGWNTDLSHQRKLKSYQVELHWYESRMNCSEISDARIPGCLGVQKDKQEVLLALEDLDASGFEVRRSDVNQREWMACVSWLACFHAQNLNADPAGLWESGTYWHLETRPDELKRLDDPVLKQAASSIDQKLKDTKFQTLVHGDAKLANFCFSEDGTQVAAVDFQYVGGGCGMKDLAYFVGSCFRDEQAEEIEEEVLDHYFTELSKSLGKVKSPVRVDELEEDWRPLYRVAWADFHRFMKGWSPGHWKLSDYSERVTREVIRNLSG
jgi:thiamine kinase-like enzyme